MSTEGPAGTAGPAHPDDVQVSVIDNPDEARFEAHWGDSVAGFAMYQLAPHLIVFTHTEVDPAFEGRGVGGVLVRGALDDVRARGLRVVALCPFVKAWIGKHQDYQDLLYSAPHSTVAD